jgi:hypothetical protein
MGWLSDRWKDIRDKVFDDVLGVDSSRGGIGGAIADAVDDVNEELKNLDQNLNISERGQKLKEEYGRIEDDVKGAVKDAGEYIEDDLGIDLKTLASAALMFTPVGAALGGMLGTGLSSVGLGSVANFTAGGLLQGGLAANMGAGLTMGARVGALMGTGAEAYNMYQANKYGYDYDFDINRIGDASFRSAGSGAIMGPLANVAFGAIGQGINKLGQGFENIGLEKIGQGMQIGNQNLMAGAKTYEDASKFESAFYNIGRGTMQSGTYQLGTEGKIDPTRLAVGAASGGLMGTGALATVGLGATDATIKSLQDGSFFGPDPMMNPIMGQGGNYSIDSGATNTTGVAKQSKSKKSTQGDSIPEAQFIETDGSQFGSAGTGGVFGGLDELDPSKGFVDTDKFANLYAQRGLGEMVTAKG